MKPEEAAEPLVEQAAAAAKQLSSMSEGADLVEAQRKVLEASRTAAAAKKVQKLAKKADKDVKKSGLKEKTPKAKAKPNCEPAAETDVAPPTAAAARPARLSWAETDTKLDNVTS
ncbi:unnamed protein product [Symbiodinium pilosum]|uniref:Uncharacterized protein n=1 Tax=Symbiodinium pilosum TaxID=2952 RepID=A0A812JHG0_SYMPI|nr:unnamed protein product [Symbiodinium pilosum]